MDLFEKEVSREYIYEGRILKLRKDLVSLPSGNVADREIIEHSGGAGCLAVTKEGKILLVKQYRRPYDEVTFEIPAGKLAQGENHAEAAARELSEETGYIAKEVKLFDIIYPTPAYCGEIIYIYFADRLEKGENHLDDDEYLDVYEFSKDEIIKMLEKGKIKDAKTVTALYHYLYITK